MAKRKEKKAPQRFVARHRSRSSQVGIYLGKLLRMFVYQSDWKVLPMAAVIAGLVGMVVNEKLFVNMEGTLLGSFAIVCVCIWNGCFNSVQVICRERDVIKREHRSGMHISAYIFSHMVYQLMLCLLQTAITLYVMLLVGVKFPAQGLITPWLVLDMGISMLLITYASDMLSLWISTIARTTTTAMTIMPFVLIFQLVFSGGMLPLPAWTQPISSFTVSSPGLKVIAAQADTNHRPFVTISSMIGKMRDTEISGEVTLGRALDLLSREDNPAIAQIRALEIGGKTTVGELKEMLYGSETLKSHREDLIVEGLTVGGLMDILDTSGLWEEFGGEVLEGNTTVGRLVDLVSSNPDIRANRDQVWSFSTSIGDLIGILGEENVMDYLEQNAAKASYVEDYELTKINMAAYWIHLAFFVFVFALLATITLEFIDKDKR